MGAHTRSIPKPMITIGRDPILVHLLKHLSTAGFRDFIIATGYQGSFIERTCASLSAAAHPQLDDASVHVMDTGLDTATGGRLRQLKAHLQNSTFMMTWADGLADVDFRKLLSFHRQHGRLATVTAVRPPARFGYLTLSEDRVTQFEEKPQHAPGWINGAFFMLESGIFDYIHSDDESWEQGAMVRLAKAGELMAYRHHGFWQCMDMPSEQAELERIWQTGSAPWKNWK